MPDALNKMVIQPGDFLKEDESDLFDREDDHSAIVFSNEDKFEKRLTSENESDENFKDSNERRPKQTLRHTKFVVTIILGEKG